MDTTFKEENLSKYLEKQHKLSDNDTAVNIAAYVLSDFKESDDDDRDDDDNDDDDVEKTETCTETFKLAYLNFIFCV